MSGITSTRSSTAAMPHQPALPMTIRLFEECLGCKWTLPILWNLRAGICRPGALQRAVSGISTKVLNQRIARLTAYGLIERVDRSQRLKHVEYRLTALGLRFGDALSAVDQVARDLDRAVPSAQAASR